MTYNASWAWLVAGCCVRSRVRAGAADVEHAGGRLDAERLDRRSVLKIQTALADDSIEGVKANAGDIATAARALGAPAMKIDTAAVQLASAAELDDARDEVRRR